MTDMLINVINVYSKNMTVINLLLTFVVYSEIIRYSPL
jgi:hypothetical protein